MERRKDDEKSVKSFDSPTKPIVKASHDDVSDYSDWDDEETEKQRENAKALKKNLEIKNQVKQIQEQKTSLGFNPDDDDDGLTGTNEQLDNLWARVKDTLNDFTDNGSKKELTTKDKPTKLRFIEACEIYDTKKQGQITLKELQQAFTTARFYPPLTESECDQLVTALDAWFQRENKIVLYGRFLDGSRQSKSIYGIFPKHQARGPSKYEKERKEKEEEEQRKKAQAEEEEKLRREAIMLKKRMENSRGDSSKQSKEDLKKQQKDEQLQKEADKKEAERLQKAEDEAVKKEVGQLKTIVESVRSKLTREGDDIRKWFNLFNENKQSRLDKQQLLNVFSNAKFNVPDRELDAIIELLDNIGDNKIQYQELCDLVQGIKIPNFVAYIQSKRAKQKKQKQEELKNAGGEKYLPSKGATIDNESNEQLRDDKLGRVDGLSSILGSAIEKKTPPKIKDNENDILRIQAEIKELLRADFPDGKPCSFDDLLALMGKPTFNKEGQVFLKDFESIIRAKGGDQQRFSAHEIKLVFNQHSIEQNNQIANRIAGTDGPFIPLRDFKDKFLPSLIWKRDDAKEIEESKNQLQLNKAGTESESLTESMVIDNILEGKKAADVARERMEKERQLEKQQQKNLQFKKPSLQIEPEKNEHYDEQSNDSRISKPIEQIVDANSKDPRKKLAAKQIQSATLKNNVLNEQALKKLAQQQKVNEQYYRQPQVAISRDKFNLSSSNFQYDYSLEKFFKYFCNALVQEAKSGPKPKEVDSFVDYYGKQYPGFINYQEFKEIYNLHVVSADLNVQPAEEGKILALFNLFDIQSRGKISRADFLSIISKGKPSLSLIERLSVKVKKGGERFIRAITEEFQEADAPFGCNGQLPLNNFQVIMADYDLPLLQSDIIQLEKLGYATKSTPDTGSFVNYNTILSKVNQKMADFSVESGLILKNIIKIQSQWRARQARREVQKRKALLGQDNKAISDIIQGRAAQTKKGPDASVQKQSTKKDIQKKKEQFKSGKNQKEVETTDQKISAILRTNKESRINEKLIQQRKEMSQYIKTAIIDDIIEAAFCYGESLEVCKHIQRKFENRPVIKYIFPLSQAFKFAIQGALPKTLQVVNQLGQVMCLDSERLLNQFDIAANKSLQSVNFGQKAPQKNYQIIDMVSDQSSGRIYTLNSNWILEIWSIEQNSPLPQKQLSVCANEGGKDFISLYYKQTFNNSKPKFLSLQQSNQQILVVNTSCVDGCIVFIDPISFSVLKKIQLRYSDYEIPKPIRDSINKLKEIFDSIREKQGKDVMAIFQDITDRNTLEIKISDFVKKLCKIDSSLIQDDIFKCCRALDTNSDGSLSLDEFLEYFGSIQKANTETAEDELEDEMWPEWLIKEGKLSFAKELLIKLYDILDLEHGITAEQAFSIYDLKDTGECQLEEFKRILKIFFGDVIEDKSDYDFLVRMAIVKSNKVDYREFCKFLSKKVVRAFKNQKGQTETKGQNKQKNELDTPLTKQASITYILRKASELNIDLRKVFIEFDKNELNVISRSKFCDLILDLPLGINEVDIQEIMENDLKFDNYGNVDYTVILNSDLFCQLERSRLKTTHKKKRAVKVDSEDEDEEDNQNSDINKVDNRKVVVEDLIYIDDLEIIIYTIIAPVTSQIFISSSKKSNNQAQSKKEEIQIITLEQVGQKNQKDDQKDSQSLVRNYYQLLAKLKGHKNQDPPSICYIPQSCCLVSGEKDLSEKTYQPSKSSFPGTSNPNVPTSHKFQKSNENSYEKHNARGGQFEILIWNIQRDMIELFSSRPPWFVPYHKKINAHNSSILDICYMAKSQLIVTCSTDQTIKFFDPISKSHELTDQYHNPHAQMRPGYYKPLQREVTKSNITFKEIKRIYAGNDFSCFSLRSLHIQNIIIDPSNPEMKSQIEWLVALNLGRPTYVQGRNTQVSYIQGYSIERVQIEVPAIHHDDIVPPFILKECEELVNVRRRKLVSQFQQGLQQIISKMFAQVQLQETFISKIRKLFMEAILQRKELRYVNPEPLREIYNLLLKLPDRTKFQSFLASSGSSDQLSVSETFFYLQKFQQIHPLRTTQIEFEKSIQEFHDKHQRQYLKGAKRWPKKSIQRFADHLRQHGLDLYYLQSGGQNKSIQSLCTRERIIQYFEEVVKPKGDNFNELDIDSILNDLDPFHTGIVQLRLLLKIYEEELHHYKLTSLNRPKEILEDIRTAVFPNKRIQLQQALAQADIQGDGFLQKDQFVKAFQNAKVRVDRDTLEFLFDIMSESYTLPQTDFELPNDKPNDQNKTLKLKFFLLKLFQEHETKEIDEIETTLSNIKSALVYKGLDFSVIFAEESEEKNEKPRRQATKRTKEERQQREKEKAEAKKQKEQNIDMTQNHLRFAQQIVKEEFCRRILSLNAQHVTPEKVGRLATFLSLNQESQTLIFLSSWLHHLRRANTTFQESDKRVLPLICTKLMRNEKVFRAALEQSGHLRGKRDDEKFIQLADLKLVLKKFGLGYINQEMFIKEFTKGQQAHIEDLITRVRSIARNYYQTTGKVASDDNFEPFSITELRKTDYFSRVHQSIRATGTEIDTQELRRRLKNFDIAESGIVKAYNLINVLKHGYPEIFTDDCLLGLQFQLECLSVDGTVDYEGFIQIFLEDSGKQKTNQNVGLDNRSLLNAQEFEDILSRINSHVKSQGLDLMRIFDIFSKSEGIVSFADLEKILSLIEFPYTEHQFQLIQQYADESGQGFLYAYSFVNQITFSKEVSAVNETYKWNVAAREILSGRYTLLENLQDHLDSIKDQMIQRYSDQDGRHCGIIMAEDFQELLGSECPFFTEFDKQLLIQFAIRGSKRAQSSNPGGYNMKIGLINLFHLQQVIEEVIQEMRREENIKNQSQIDENQNTNIAKYRQQVNQELAKKQKQDQEFFNSEQGKRQLAVKSKIVSLFQERDVSFFDCFQNIYDSLNQDASIISVSNFKNKIRQLNLPLSVQEQRVLRRIADPKCIGKVDVRNFCLFFETSELRNKRLHKILDKVATAFYIQGFNMRRAFGLFDADGDGQISAREFRQGMAALNLQLRYDEIDDLMQLCDSGKDGNISYDEFISKMDLSIQNRQEQVMENVEEFLFKSLGEAMEYSSESLFQIMSEYDVQKDGTIDSQDLVKVIKKLGLMNPEPNIHLIMKAGGCQINNKRIQCSEFASNIENEIIKRHRLNSQIHEKVLNKISALMKVKDITFFEFFIMLDVNKSGSVSKIEFKTGIQQLGLNLNPQEFESVWQAIYQQINEMPHDSQPNQQKRFEPKVEAVNYVKILNSFVKAKCLKIQMAVDHSDTLLSKFRSQLKKMRISVEKAYKTLDPNNIGSVQKKDFIEHCFGMGFNFSEDELIKLFENICQQCKKKATTIEQQVDHIERGNTTAFTRFNYKQLQEAVLVQKDEKWLFLACIKIHGLVLQKGLSYKRLFLQWKDKQSKTQAGRLNEKELAQGLKKLKAGLTTDEVDKLCGSLTYEGKDLSISPNQFEEYIQDGARKLETERSFERLILQDWITKFNDCVTRGGVPLERLFYENDSDQVGSLSFENFSYLNEQLELNMHRKDLQKIFGILDKQRTKRISLGDIKGVASLIQNEEEMEEANLFNDGDESTEGLSGAALIQRNELNDLYDQIKENLENMSLTFESIIYQDLKRQPNELATTKGIQQVFEKLQLIVQQSQVDIVLNDVRKANKGKFECSFKQFIDFMTRKRINVAFVDKGFIDPLIAQCCQSFAKAKDVFNMTFEELFDIFESSKKKILNKDNFLICSQGFQADIPIEDLLELFNYIDTNKSNQITKVQFVDAFNYITSKIGGQNQMESQSNKAFFLMKKGGTNRQQMMNILKDVADSILRKQLDMRQVMTILDYNKTGFLSRTEFSQILRGLCDTINIEQSRLLQNFFDQKATGKISSIEVISVIQSTIDQQIGGGIYSFMLVKPLINKIINSLAIDADKFFDELAEKNEIILKEEELVYQNNKRQIQKSLEQMTGLSKRLFFSQLELYGVNLSEQDKAQICQTFSHDTANDKLNYQKLDQAFEGEQQVLFAQEAFYTVQWERRIFIKMGQQLRKQNMSIEELFDLIDDDKSETISLQELKQAIIRFDLNLNDRQAQLFIARLAESGKNYISKNAFIKRFWAAYTYDEVAINTQEQKQQTSSSYSRVTSEQQNKLKTIKMMKAIQKQIKKSMTSSDAFSKLDSGVGFLTLNDFQKGMSQLFGITLRQYEVQTFYFEIDADENGIISFQEWDNFYRIDYDNKIQELEKEKDKMITQYEIFEHLLKVLKRRDLTLEEMFDQIDVDKNQFIEVDEFHETLECMGFVISQEQVFQLMRQMDENFDGRISYDELKNHILKMGLNLDKVLESRNQKGQDQKKTTFMWRDKGLELIIRSLQAKLNGKTYEEFFGIYDSDYDGNLSPSEFRSILLSLKENQLTIQQIERVLHVLLEEKQQKPLVSIQRTAKFLRNYSCLDEETGKAGGNALLINQDLFVYIVERYDGFSRLLEQFTAVEERAQYISKHTHEINLRGLNMLANQMNLEKIHRRAQAVNSLYDSTLVLLAIQANRIIRDEAQLCVLDPTYSINTIVGGAGLGRLGAVSIPILENSHVDIDYNSVEILPSGAQKLQGVLVKQRKKVEVLIYGKNDLIYVSADGTAYRRHLDIELKVHRSLMGVQYDDDDELVPEEMDIIPNIGKSETKVGLTASDTEIRVVNELIDESQWINLDDFVNKNGGILNIPLFYHTDAPLFIIRHWAKMILKIIKKVHDVSAVLRCLQLSQVWVSRDGQKIKLGHVRGVGKVDNFGFLQSSPDIYMSLESTIDDRKTIAQSSTHSPEKSQRKLGAASSSKKTEGARQFSNSCLDNPFIAPETLYLKSVDQSSALDVWSFGMIMYCLLLGKKPRSFYAVYREWYKKCHGHDVEMGALPFAPPSTTDFLYDPFSVDFENPFEEEDLNQPNILDIQGSLKQKQSEKISFENFIKCLKGMSYSALFTQENSKKFQFKMLADQNQQQDINKPPRFPGQANTNEETRLKVIQSFARATVLARKNELGLILDLISSCLDIDLKQRPTINGLLNSPIFQLDSYELTKAIRFSQNVIIYRSPQSSVTQRITMPLRNICLHAINNPQKLIHIQEDILKLFAATEDCIAHISSLPIDEINQVLTEKERRRALLDPSRSSILKGRDFSKLRVSPNSPLAEQIIQDHVIDMLIFITFRFTKAFQIWKSKIENEQEQIQSPQQNKNQTVPSQTEGTRQSKSYRQDGATERTTSQNQLSTKEKSKRLQNYILARMSRLLKTLLYEMHSYSTPIAPFVKEVVDYVVKFFVGEEFMLGSDIVLQQKKGQVQNLNEYLKERSFFRKDQDLSEKFKSDAIDKSWHLEQKNLSFLDKSNHWSIELHREATKIYRDAITESGMGQGCYPVLNDYITNVTNSFEPSKIFSKQMNQLSLSFLIPMNRTTAYYNELTPISECLNRLHSPNIETAGERCALAMIRSVFQTGSSDKIKACLDLRVPKHIIRFLQDPHGDVRKECLHTLLEISKGLQDEDQELMGKSAVNLIQDYSRRAFRRTAFDQHKVVSMAAQSEAVDADQDQDVPMTRLKNSKNQQIPQTTTDGYSSYIKRTIALIEKNENERFINFALDLPNLNFLSSKRFLREMAVCFESPVFIAPLTRLLKSKSEPYENKELVLKILENLFSGHERVLTAINSPASDTYMTLLRLLMQSTKTQNARANPQGLSALMRNHLALQDKAKQLFVHMFEQRRPTIIRDLSCIGAASTLLREQGLKIPDLVSLPEIVAFFDDFADLKDQLVAEMIEVKDFLSSIKDLRCWVKHFYDQSSIPELTRIKALMRCSSFLVKIVALVWDDYKNATPERKLEYLQLIRQTLQFFDWLCVKEKEIFLFNEECGRTNLRFIIDRCNMALSQFRAPQEHIQLPLEDLAFNNKKNKESQSKRMYDMFPFTEIGAILQNIQYQLIRKDSRFLNRILSEASFGFVFGEQLILEYNFIRHCIDNKIESLVLIDSYVKKNEIRLNTYEFLLRSSEDTLKDQFMSSGFIEKMFEDYVSDFREFNIQFSKIDLEFLAFRRSYPIRLECISLFNTTIMLKSQAIRIFTELLTYSRRHFLIKSELDFIRTGRITNKESTSLLLFAIILESNEENMINVMMQEGAPEVLRNLIRDNPSIGRKFNILQAYTSPF